MKIAGRVNKTFTHRVHDGSTVRIAASSYSSDFYVQGSWI